MMMIFSSDALKSLLIRLQVTCFCCPDGYSSLMVTMVSCSSSHCKASFARQLLTSAGSCERSGAGLVWLTNAITSWRATASKAGETLKACGLSGSISGTGAVSESPSTGEVGLKTSLSEGGGISAPAKLLVKLQAMIEIDKTAIAHINLMFERLIIFLQSNPLIRSSWLRDILITFKENGSGLPHDLY